MVCFRPGILFNVLQCSWVEFPTALFTFNVSDVRWVLAWVLLRALPLFLFACLLRSAFRVLSSFLLLYTLLRTATALRPHRHPVPARQHERRWHSFRNGSYETDRRNRRTCGVKYGTSRTRVWYFLYFSSCQPAPLQHKHTFSPLL